MMTAKAAVSPVLITSPVPLSWRIPSEFIPLTTPDPMTAEIATVAV